MTSLLKLKDYIVILIFCSVLIVYAGGKKTKVVTDSILSGKSFTLVSASTGLKLNNIKITISFDDSNRFSGFSGVNRYFGNYGLRRGNIIVLSQMGMTKMAGPPEVMLIEDAYINLLNEASYVVYDKKILTISTIEDKKLVFEENR